MRALLRRSLLVIASLATVALLAGCVAPPEELACRADHEGNHLSWAAVENATSYHVYRGEGGSDFGNSTFVGTTVETQFTDSDVEVGQTYRYWVTAVGPAPEMSEEELAEVQADDPEFEWPDELESFPSEPCDVTAIPEFPTLAAGALALVGAVGVYVAIRRRG